MNRAIVLIGALVLAALPARALAQNDPPSPIGAPEVSVDPSLAGIAAVNRAGELLKSQGGPDVAIAYFVDALNNSRNAAVQRAIRFYLAVLYNDAGRTDKALEVLKDQIASIPPVAPPQQVQLVPAETTGTTAAPAQ